MIHRQLTRIRSAKQPVYFVKIVYIIAMTKFFHHAYKNKGKLSCIVTGTVMIERSKL